MQASKRRAVDVDRYVGESSTLPADEQAREALVKAVAAIAKAQGYDAIEASAMAYIVNNLESLLCSLPTYSHYMSVLANRKTPSTRDVFAALSHAGPRLRPEELERFAKGREQAAAQSLSWSFEKHVPHTEASWCDPLKGCLPSESEDDSEVEEEKVVKQESSVITTRRSKAAAATAASTPSRKRRRKKFRPEMVEVPTHLPSLPPKHTWLSTASYPAHAIHLQPPLAFLDLKVSSNRLMEASLRGLIRATDAAALDSQTQSDAKEEAASSSNAINFEVNLFGNGDKRKDERPAISPQSTTTALNSKAGGTSPLPQQPGSSSAAAVAAEDSTIRARTKAGRTLSLRLRTPSISAAAAMPIALTPEDHQNNHEEGQIARYPPPPKRTISHRPSMSLLGSQSASLANFSSHIRRNTFAAGPWSALPQQSPSSFGWNAANPTFDYLSPVSTPLTAGPAYQYPSTPLEDSDAAGGSHLTDSIANLALPPTVNYKRTWYKKSNNSNNMAAANQQRRVKS